MGSQNHSTFRLFIHIDKIFIVHKFIYIAKDHVIIKFINIMKETANINLINLILWTFGTMELQNNNQNSNQPILIQYKTQILLFKLMKQFRCFNVIANIFYVLSHIANGNAYSRQKLIDNGVLQVLSDELDELHLKCNCSCLLLEVWENASLLLCNLSTKIFNHSMSILDYMQFCYILLLILSKTLKINKTIIQHKQLTIEHYINNVSNYQNKLEIINYIFRNICMTLYRITQHHQYMVNFLMQELMINNSLLKLCITMISYKESKMVRMCIIQFFNNIFAEDSIRNIDLCLESGYIDEIINYCQNKSKQVSTMERSNIILSLSNLLASDHKHRIKVLNNQQLLQIIFNGLYHDEIHVVMSSLYCLNNVLEGKEKETSDILLKYQDGKIINAICVILKMKNVKWDKMKMDEVCNVMDLVKNIVGCMIINIIDIHWICERFKREKINDIFKHLKLINDNQEQKDCVDVTYLKQLSLSKYIFSLEFLINKLCEQ